MTRFISCTLWGERQFVKTTINVDNIMRFSPGPNNGTNVIFRDGSLELIRLTYDEFSALVNSTEGLQQNAEPLP